jgi:hypothetical protein
MPHQLPAVARLLPCQCTSMQMACCRHLAAHEHMGLPAFPKALWQECCTILTTKKPCCPWLTWMWRSYAGLMKDVVAVW